MKVISYPNLAAEFVALTHYCRWLPEKSRRENWNEVIDRVVEFLQDRTVHSDRVPASVWTSLRKRMGTFSVFPSMRLVATAGPAAERNNTCCYNCAYLPIDGLRSFSELLYILMCGTGAGFSVEKENTSRLPKVAAAQSRTRKQHMVEDSREGWAAAFLFGLEAWFRGERVEFDFSRLRPGGSRLVTMGGTASGPGPLQRLFRETEQIISEARGRRLSSLECHDICCHVAASVVVGGRRRAAMISYSDLEDDEMRLAKQHPFPTHRFLANNSAVYKMKPDPAVFQREWSALACSGTGERGILNVSHLERVCPTRRFQGNERTNPCGEIILRPYEFCNLSEAVVRPKDDFAALAEKVRTAAWVGVMQSTFTRFPFLRPEWRRNAEEERLIGVSLTGQLDNPAILTPANLRRLKQEVARTARRAARLLGINPPAAYTCAKPSGTVSQVADCAPGCHPRWSRHYVRRYRINRFDPVFLMLRDQGLGFRPEVGQTKDDFTTAVFEFPVRSPAGSILRKDWDAIRQMNWYRRVQQNWSTHNVSTTIYVKDGEWQKVGDYVYEHWDDIVGMTFFDYQGGRYELAPYEEVGRQEYAEMKAGFPKLDFSRLGEYEEQTGDTTLTGHESGCFRGSPECDIGA